MTGAAAIDIDLPDGRILVCQAVGPPAPDGVPVLFFGDAPGSRLIAPADPELPARLGVQLWTFDRPGYGRSTRQRGRVVHDWTRDVEDVADRLGLARFGVAGWRAGAAFALGAAEVLADRVTGVALVSPFGPFDDPDALDHLAPGTARSVRLVRSRHIGTRAAAAVASARLRREAERRHAHPAAYVDGLARRTDLPPPDRCVLTRVDVQQQLAADAEEATAQGAAGWADDLAAVSKPWGIEYRRVHTPVTVWHGSDDPDIAPASAAELAGALPHADLRIVDGAGPWVLYDIWPDVLAAAARPVV